MAKKCVPCETGAPPLTPDEIERRLGGLSGWELVDGKKIEKTYTFKTFADAIAFVNKVASCAEEEGHHPGISITWRRVVISFFTHAIGGLSENDFIIAREVDALTPEA